MTPFRKNWPGLAFLAVVLVSYVVFWGGAHLVHTIWWSLVP